MNVMIDYGIGHLASIADKEVRIFFSVILSAFFVSFVVIKTE